MNIKNISNPYVTEPGKVPKHVAGRDKELNQIYESIEEQKGATNSSGTLKNDHNIPPLFFIGPRGVGKTVLLTLAHEHAIKKNIKFVFIASRHFANSSSLLDLLSRIRDPKFLDKIKKATVGPSSIVSVELNFEKKLVSFESELRSWVSKKPILLLIDEAHTFDLKTFNYLINIIQELRIQKYPLSVMFAGTPGLEELMKQSKATFSGRYEKVRLNTLDYNATKLAIKKPAEKHKVLLTDEILDMFAKITDNYPYFIQLLGTELWSELKVSKTKKCSINIAKKVIKKFKIQKEMYYRTFANEIDDYELIDEAVTAINYLKQNKTATRNKLSKELQAKHKLSHNKALAIYKKFYNLGIICQGINDIEPAIPSFFNYFLKKFDE